jgi:hypothetical protein
MLNANRLRELGLPAAAGVVAAGVGVVLTRKPKVRDVVPDVKGVGDVMDDLRGKLESVVRRGGTTKADTDTSQDRDTQQSERDQLAERRRAREQRRNERRSQTGR